MRKLLMFGAMAIAMALPTVTAEAYEGLWCLRYSAGRSLRGALFFSDIRSLSQ